MSLNLLARFFASLHSMTDVKIVKSLHLFPKRKYFIALNHVDSYLACLLPVSNIFTENEDCRLVKPRDSGRELKSRNQDIKICIASSREVILLVPDQVPNRQM